MSRLHWRPLTAAAAPLPPDKGEERLVLDPGLALAEHLERNPAVQPLARQMDHPMGLLDRRLGSFFDVVGFERIDEITKAKYRLLLVVARFVQSAIYPIEINTRSIKFFGNLAHALDRRFGRQDGGVPFLLGDAAARGLLDQPFQ
jgi:hypothetical protein